MSERAAEGEGKAAMSDKDIEPVKDAKEAGGSSGDPFDMSGMKDMLGGNNMVRGPPAQAR